MPAPLPDTYRRVSLRLYADDLDLVAAVCAEREGGVNGLVRDLLRAWCDRRRATDQNTPT